MKFYGARDEDGELYLYTKIPERETHRFIAEKNDDYIKIPRELFPDLKFKDDPVEVELKIENLNVQMG